jgi:hypothetical protein
VNPSLGARSRHPVSHGPEKSRALPWPVHHPLHFYCPWFLVTQLPECLALGRGVPTRDRERHDCRDAGGRAIAEGAATERTGM